ncbi:hypothetical protein GQM09_27555, partial [Escherichia coli]|nr:hypothetical protein [Escherichia coli]
MASQDSSTWRKKVAGLTEELRKANATITGLGHSLQEIEREKLTLEQALANEKKRVQAHEQSLTKLKQQPVGNAQQLALDSLAATLPNSASRDKQQNQQLTEQLSQANAKSDALNKELIALREQKQALEAKLSGLETRSGETAQKNTQQSEQLAA